MQRQLSKVIKNHRAWLHTHGERVFSGSRASLDNGFDGSVQSLNGMEGSVNGLATYYGIRGIVDVLDEMSDGWAHISHSIDLRGWSLRIRAEFVIRQLNLGAARSPLTLANFTSIAACLVCVSEAWAHMSETILRLIASVPLASNSSFEKHRLRFEPFVLNYCRKSDGGDPIWDDRDWGPYRRILDAGDDQQELGSALQSACDYHCRHMEDRGQDWNPEFKYAPFDLLPCEVMLVRRLRAKRGLETPEVKHDLVSALGLKADAVPSFPQSEFISRVESAFSKCYSESRIDEMAGR